MQAYASWFNFGALWTKQRKGDCRYCQKLPTDNWFDTPEVGKPDGDARANQYLSRNAVTPAIISTDAEQLANLVRRWPMLSHAMRSAILILVRNGSSTR